MDKCIREDCKNHTYEGNGCKKEKNIQNCIARKEKEKCQDIHTNTNS